MQMINDAFPAAPGGEVPLADPHYAVHQAIHDYVAADCSVEQHQGVHDPVVTDHKIEQRSAVFLGDSRDLAACLMEMRETFVELGQIVSSFPASSEDEA